MVYDNLGLDFQFPADPIFTDTQMGLFLNATLFNQSIGYKVPATQISDLSVSMA